MLISQYHSRQISFENMRVSDTSPAIWPAKPRTTTAQSADGERATSSEVLLVRMICVSWLPDSWVMFTSYTVTRWSAGKGSQVRVTFPSGHDMDHCSPCGAEGAMEDGWGGEWRRYPIENQNALTLSGGGNDW